MKSFGQNNIESWSKKYFNEHSWQTAITYPSVTDDGQDPVVFNWDIYWNESGYQADNSKGWEEH